jgi:hypothetical protein
MKQAVGQGPGPSVSPVKGPAGSPKDSENQLYAFDSVCQAVLQSFPERVAAPASGCPQQTGGWMALETNKQLVRRYIEEVLNGGDLAVVDELFAPPLNDQVRSVAGFLRSAFPDMHETLHDLVAEEDKVMARWTFRGTHLGRWHEFSPTGKAVEMIGFSIYVIDGGRIVADQAVMDMVDGLEQIGVTFVLPGASSLPAGDSP